MAKHTNLKDVGTTVVRLDSGRDPRSGVEIQNRREVSIYCALGESDDLAVDGGREVTSGEVWTIAAPGNVPVYAIAESEQDTDKQVVVTEF